MFPAPPSSQFFDLCVLAYSVLLANLLSFLLQLLLILLAFSWGHPSLPSCLLVLRLSYLAVLSYCDVVSPVILALLLRILQTVLIHLVSL